MKTIEEKAKAYDEAIKRGLDYIRHTPATEMVTRQDIFEAIFPELKESEEERIVRCLLNYFNHVRYNGLDLKGTDIDEVIAWLEKQGEKVTNINEEDYDIVGLYHAIRILEKTIGRVIGYQSHDGILSHEAAINAVKELYKKQGGQDHFYDFNANDWYVSKVDGKIHNMTYNPADKIEPKFKVGDWIVDKSGHIQQVLDFRGGIYTCTHNSFTIDCESNYHLWTIEDAKAGDVLVYETDEVEWIFIYREIVPAASEVPHDLLRYYFLLEGNYFNWNGVSAMITDDYKLYLKPATKEQQDTLFAKMKEAGYEWDSEKKELKKIEVKTLNADKVIEWLNDQACLGWIEDVEVDNFVEKFKKDFELC